MVDVTDGTYQSPLATINAGHNQTDDGLPMLTWGLVRSKAVAIPRAASRSLVKTWWTGLAARGRSSEDRLVRKRRLAVLVMLDILTTQKWNHKHNSTRERDGKNNEGWTKEVGVEDGIGTNFRIP